LSALRKDSPGVLCRILADRIFSIRPIVRRAPRVRLCVRQSRLLMPPSSLKATPPPDGKIVRDVLLRALRELGLEPQDSWVAVRVARAGWTPGQTYTVVIAYEAARVGLSGLLRGSASTAENHAVGVWVLNEAEARELCDGRSTPLRSPSEQNRWREAPALGVNQSPLAADALLQWVRLVK